MRTHYTPTTKQELIDWLSNFYGYRNAKWAKMAKKQLHAIYFTIRKKVDNE